MGTPGQVMALSCSHLLPLLLPLLLLLMVVPNSSAMQDQESQNRELEEALRLLTNLDPAYVGLLRPRRSSYNNNRQFLTRNGKRGVLDIGDSLGGRVRPRYGKRSMGGWVSTLEDAEMARL